VGARSRQALSTLVTPGAPGPEQQDAPLTEAERKLLVRLLSDPTYFPVEFRTWIRTYLEGSDIRLPSSAIVGGNAPKVNLPPGVILPFAGSTIPSNTLLCNGQAVLRADYELLFNTIGTSWGVGNGTSTFNVPDLRDRALYGAGSVVGLAAHDGRAAGSRGGPIHRHYFGQTSGEAGYHSHGGGVGGVGDHSHGTPGETGQGFNIRVGTGSQVPYLEGRGGGTHGAGGHGHSIGGDGSHTHFTSGDTSGGYDYDKPSYAGVNYVIATGKN
jgi:hypothetical protein